MSPTALLEAPVNAGLLLALTADVAIALLGVKTLAWADRGCLRLLLLGREKKGDGIEYSELS